MRIARALDPGWAQRRSSAASWSRRAATFGVVLGLVAVAAHRFRLIETLPFFWIAGLVLCLALAALLLAASAFPHIWYRGDRGGRNMTAGALVGLLLLAPFGLAAWRAYAFPALTDISTDLDDPPAMTALAAFRPDGANPIRSPTAENIILQQRTYPDITGRRYPIAFEQALAAVDSLLGRRGWEVISPLPDGTEPEFTFEALARSPILGLPYDVAVRVTDEGNGVYVDMRSAARYGDRDLGADAALIAAFLADLDVDAGTLSGVTTPGGDDNPADELPTEDAPIPTPAPQ